MATRTLSSDLGWMGGDVIFQNCEYEIRIRHERKHECAGVVLCQCWNQRVEYSFGNA